MDIVFNIVYFLCSKDYIKLIKGKTIFKKARNANRDIFLICNKNRTCAKKVKKSFGSFVVTLTIFRFDSESGQLNIGYNQSQVKVNLNRAHFFVSMVH